MENMNEKMEILEALVAELFADKEKLWNSLILRPINFQANQHELVDVPYILNGDIALVLYAEVSYESGEYFTTKIRKALTGLFGCSECEILEHAMENTAKKHPLKMWTATDLMKCSNLECMPSVDLMDNKNTVVIKKNRRGLIVTNDMELNGAIVVFYPGIAERIAEVIDGSFWVGFTSIHEAQVHAADELPPEVARMSLKDTNKFCNCKEEILTSNLYMYDRNTKKIRMVSEEGEENGEE